jgi:hypothetical protein
MAIEASFSIPDGTTPGPDFLFFASGVAAYYSTSSNPLLFNELSSVNGSAYNDFPK